MSLTLLLWTLATGALAQPCTDTVCVVEDLEVVLAAVPPQFRRFGPRRGPPPGWQPRGTGGVEATVEAEPVETEPVEAEPVEAEPVEAELATPKPATPKPATPKPATRAPTYHYQYDNRLSPGASCQNTSLSMLLSAYGVDVSPDAITGRFGKDLAQSPDGLARVFNHYASAAGIRERLEPTVAGTLAEFRQLAAGPDPVIVHGYFTAGHVVMTTGYDGAHYTVSDPAGTWNQTFMGGYPRAGSEPTAGDGVRYARGAFERAIATAADGRTPAPLWYHRVIRP